MLLLTTKRSFDFKNFNCVTERRGKEARADHLSTLETKNKSALSPPATFFVIGPILWGHSGPLCHALSLLSLFLSLWTSILHCHSPGVATVARHPRYSYSWLRLILVVVSTVATPGEWQCKIRTGGVRRLAVANGPNIFQMLLVCKVLNVAKLHKIMSFFASLNYC